MLRVGDLSEDMRSCVCRKVETALRIQIIGSKAQLASELIGIEDGRYLMIKMPPIYSMVDASGLLYKGNTIFVRYLHNDTVFGFQSQISNFIIKAELIFIYYPNKIENYDLRGHKRIDCYLPANVNIADNIIKAGIININKDGCLTVIDSSRTDNHAGTKVELLEKAFVYSVSVNTA